MSTAAYSLFAAIIIRLVLIVAPFIGLNRRDIRAFALRGAELEEALELMGVLDTRLVLYSWPLFAIVTLATRIGELSKTIAWQGLPVVVLVVLILLVGSYMLLDFCKL